MTNLLNTCIEYDRITAEVKGYIRRDIITVWMCLATAGLLVALALILWVTGVVDGAAALRSQGGTAWALLFAANSYRSAVKWARVIE